MAKLITFDDEDSSPTSLPPSAQHSAAGDPSKAQVALEFLRQYLRIYDSDSRVELLQAYHDEATMSMTTAYNQYAERNYKK